MVLVPKLKMKEKDFSILLEAEADLGFLERGYNALRRTKLSFNWESILVLLGK